MDSHPLSTQTNANGLSQSAGLQTDAQLAQQQTPQEIIHQQVSNQNQQAVQTSQFQSESPLLGICPKPVHLMTEQEKRNHLAKVRNLRSNFAGWRAGVSTESRGDKEKDKEKVEVKEPISTGLEDLI